METPTNHLEWTSLLWALCSGNHGNSNRSFKPATSSHCSWIIKSFGALSSGNHGSPNQDFFERCSGNHGNSHQSSWMNPSSLSIVFWKLWKLQAITLHELTLLWPWRSTGSIKVPCSKSLSAVKADEFPGVLGFGGLGPQVSVIRPESLKTGVPQSSSPR